MPANALLPVAGKAQDLVFRVPAVGEILVRGGNRLLGRLAFHAPLLGGKKSSDIRSICEQWFAFLNRNGISPSLESMDDESFVWSVSSCPYGFCRPEQWGVCDAAMDLDRTYLRLLGAGLVIKERIPQGTAKCLFVSRKL